MMCSDSYSVDRNHVWGVSISSLKSHWRLFSLVSGENNQIHLSDNCSANASQALPLRTTAFTSLYQSYYIALKWNDIELLIAAPAELSIWFAHHSALCRTVSAKLLSKTVEIASVTNHTLKGHQGCVLACVYICPKPHSWAHLTPSGSLEVSLLSTKINPEINFNHWQLLIKAKNTVAPSALFGVCVYVTDLKVSYSDLVSSRFCWGIMGKGLLS